MPDTMPVSDLISAAFAALPDAACILEQVIGPDGKGADWRFLAANAAMRTMFALENPIGEAISNRAGPYTEAYIRDCNRIAAGGVSETILREEAPYPGVFECIFTPLAVSHPPTLMVVVRDVTAEHAARRSLANSENRLRSLIDATPDVVYQMSPDWSELRDFQGRSAPSGGIAPGRWIDNYTLPEDREEIASAIAASIREEEPFDLEHRARKADGSLGWFHSRAFPVRNQAGEIIEWFGMASEVTDRRNSEEQLRRGAEMLRMASKIGAVGLWDWRVGTDEVVWSDENFRLLGYAPGTVTPSFELWRESVHPEDRDRILAAIERSLEVGEDYVAEYRLRQADGRIAWVLARGRALPGKDGSPERMLGAIIETTERRRQEEWQKLLVAELQHRVRNLISMMRSVVRQSADSHADVGEYVDHLIGRLEAMGRTQSSLARVPGAKVNLAEVIHEELIAHAAHTRGLHIEGPDIELSPKAAEVVTLAVHELATNSIKYGALGAAGHIRIVWTVADRGADRWVQLRWQETVPVAGNQSDRRGFGRQLIEERVPYELRGEGLFTVHDTGVLAELAFPLTDGSSILETRPRGANQP